MADVLYPSAVDYLRKIVDNTVDNLLAGKPSYLEMPPSYRRAYILAHQTGIVPVDTDFEVSSPDAQPVRVAITKDPWSKR